MEVIDFHTHIFPDDLAPRAIAKLREYTPEAHNYTDGTLGGLRNSMQMAGITRSVVLSIATKPSQVTVINRGCPPLMSEDIIPFGTLHPEHEAIEEEIGFLRESGIKGIKLHPEYQNFYVDDPKLFPIYEQLSSAGLIVLFHAGKDPGPFTCDHALPQSLRTVHENFPKLKMVAAHMGGWLSWTEVEEVLCGIPIFFDTSAAPNFLDPNDFERMVRKHGADRIVFGTDSPWYDQKYAYDWIDRTTLSDTEKEAIFFKNARCLLELA
jgi:uncharacterized protein